MAIPRELAAMRQAIALSAFGLGSTSPNPPVGCVILNESGQPTGQGYHRRKGEPHAEALALAAAGEQAHGGTAVVTLEPCNHHGRTPPCHQALIDAGIRRVVVALADPTSRGEGGIARLRQAGIEVEVDVLAGEARLVLGSWLQGLTTGRPFVRWLSLPDTAPENNALAVIPDAADLLTSHDVVITADGGVREAVPGAHGDNLQLPARVDLAQTEQVLTGLYAGGVRTVLLVCGPDDARPFLAAACVDEAYLHGCAAADHGPRGWDLISAMNGRMTRVAKMSGWVRITIQLDRAYGWDESNVGNVAGGYSGGGWRMVELLRSNDPVLMSFAASLLEDAGIEHNVVDLHMSVIEGSIGALPSRLLVAQDRYDEARGLLVEAGVPV